MTTVAVAVAVTIAVTIAIAVAIPIAVAMTIAVAVAIAIAMTVAVAVAVAIAIAIAIAVAMTVTVASSAVLLVEVEGVHDRRVARRDKVVTEVSGVLESETTPAEDAVNTSGVTLGQGLVKRVKSIVMAANTVGDVHWCLGVVVVFTLGGVWDQSCLR